MGVLHLEITMATTLNVSQFSARPIYLCPST